jgi:hypothetical protein
MGDSEKRWKFQGFFAAGCRSILHCLLLADRLISQIFHHTQPIGTFAQRVSVPFGHFLVAFWYSLIIAQRLSNNLWTFSLSSAQPLSYSISEHSKQLSRKTGQFLSIFFKAACLQFFTFKNFKIPQQPSSNTGLSYKITHSQSQSRATVPLTFHTFW